MFYFEKLHERENTNSLVISSELHPLEYARDLQTQLQSKRRDEHQLMQLLPTLHHLMDCYDEFQFRDDEVVRISGRIAMGAYYKKPKGGDTMKGHLEVIHDVTAEGFYEGIGIMSSPLFGSSLGIHINPPIALRYGDSDHLEDLKRLHFPVQAIRVLDPVI